MAAAVHTILEDLNEKDAKASTRLEKKDGVRVKAEDTAETGAEVSSAAPAAAPAASNVVHVHEHTVARISQRALNPLLQ